MENLKFGELSFRTLSFIGLWRPNSLKSLWAIRLYNFFIIIGLLHLFYFSATVFIDFFEEENNSEVFIQNVIFFNTFLLITCKAAYFNYHRNDVISLMKLLLKWENLPRNIEEELIFKKFQDKERIIERLFMISASLAATIFIFLSMIYERAVSLPFMRWKPYAVNSKTIFWMTYLYECIIGYVMVFAYASLETLSISFIQQICTNIDIFINRLLRMQNIRQNTVEKMDIYQQECNLIKDCVNNHLRIFLMQKALNDFFSLIIFFQFFYYIFNLCNTCFCLTKVKLSDDRSWFLIVTSFSLACHILLYCYLGEELTQKSLSISDEIYKMDWTLLTTKTRGSLKLIMMRSNKPIQLTGALLISLSLETFLSVIKASYSAFNLLRQTN